MTKSKFSEQDHQHFETDGKRQNGRRGVPRELDFQFHIFQVEKQIRRDGSLGFEMDS